MHALALAMILVGAGGAGLSLLRVSSRPRPQAILYALAAPIALGVALLGGVLYFIPDFLKG